MRFSIAFLFLFFCTSSFAEGIEFFHGTYQEAIEEATKQEKIIFVDAYTTWCGPCKRMAKQVFTKDEAGAFFNANFINIKIDMEKPNGREFGSNYPVSAYPTLFFLDSNGKIIQKIVGGKSLEALLALGNDIISKYDFSVKFREAYEAGDRSYENTIAYVNALNKSNKSSLKIANEFLLQNKDLTPQQKSDFIFAAASELDSKIFETMLENKNQYIKQYGAKVVQDKILNAAVRTRNKAFEYESESLLQLANKTIKKHYKSAAKSFIAESFMIKALQDDNPSDYVKFSKKYLKTLSTLEDKINWSKNAMSSYKENSEILTLIQQTLEQPLANTTDKNNITLYTKVLLGLKKNNEALEYLKRLEPSISDGATKKHVLSLITYIEKLDA